MGTIKKEGICDLYGGRASRAEQGGELLKPYVEKKIS
jgi:hypothetical protein